MDQSNSRSDSQVVVKQEPMNESTIYVDDDYPEGKVSQYNATTVSGNVTDPYSALLMPLSYDLKRDISQNRPKIVTYKTPCGRLLRDMSEVREYLSKLNVNIQLNVDNFSFEKSINCLNIYQIDRSWCLVHKSDLSNGIERLPIQLVNQYDATEPPPFVYSIDRMPMAGVNLNLDPEFLCGCDCADDCADKSECACWQLTLKGAKYLNPKTPNDKIGYVYKRLPKLVPTGIYECNDQCKCNTQCLNRVVQKPYKLQWELQVFRTKNRGWGVRSLCDIPKGSFICCYTGQILVGSAEDAEDAEDAEMDENVKDLDYTYQADLNYIEAVEERKEGYEQGVVDNESQASSSNAVAGQAGAAKESIRKLYGQNEAVYVMDSKNAGNFSRFINHSCDPNLFVQNVFVDTHDLRFPWGAFFASKNIRAGTELTWDYGYEVGSVPGKKLICQCGAKNCRGRIL